MVAGLIARVSVTALVMAASSLLSMPASAWQNHPDTDYKSKRGDPNNGSMSVRGEPSSMGVYFLPPVKSGGGSGGSGGDNSGIQDANGNGVDDGKDADNAAGGGESEPE